MAGRKASRGAVSRDQWAAQIAALDNTRSGSRPRKVPITVGRIVDAALQLVEAEGFDALTMRRVAAALQTGPASLYAHVRDKAELDDLMIGELCSLMTTDDLVPGGLRYFTLCWYFVHSRCFGFIKATSPKCQQSIL